MRILILGGFFVRIWYLEKELAKLKHDLNRHLDIITGMLNEKNDAANG